MDRQKVGQTESWIDRKLDRQKVGQTESWIDRQLDRQLGVNRQLDRQTVGYIVSLDVQIDKQKDRCG